VFWTWIDAKYFGGGDSYEDRIQLLGEEERNGIEDFVRRSWRSKKSGRCMIEMRRSLRLWSRR